MLALLFATAVTASLTVHHAQAREFTTSVLLAQSLLKEHPGQKLQWDWKDAIFLYGLDRLKNQLPADSSERAQFEDALTNYHAHWDSKGTPKIDLSDRCPSALTALSLAEDSGNWIGMGNAGKVAHYIHTQRRNHLGTLNHLGSSWMNLVYPHSIWVDSLMMYGVFAAKWARFTHDAELREFAGMQPLVFASVLQDRRSGLFKHAWLVEQGKAVPGERAFWLRGNAWVFTSIVEIIETLPQDDANRPQLLALLTSIAKGFTDSQNADGTWWTIMNRPGFAYEEASGTALAAYALAKGARLGFLPAAARDAGQRAWRVIKDRLISTRDGGLSMPGISGSTNAFPLWFYAQVPLKADLSYGVGAYLLASSELEP